MLVPGFAHDLFLSYAHADAAWVRAFKTAFSQHFHEREGRPISIWQDSESLRPGTKWTSELEEGVKRAAALMAVISPAIRLPIGARKKGAICWTITVVSKA